MKTGESLPNTDWVADNHWCVPLYYTTPSPAESGLEAVEAKL
jgi:hypothetical protein